MAPGGNMRMQCSQKGIDLIKSFEGFSLTAYHGKCDRAGLYTIGWGHARGVRPGDKITLEQAEKLLRDDLAWVERVLNADLVSGRDNPIVTQNEYDALCSLVFNIGSQAYLDSTVRRKIKQGDKMGAAHAFGMWIYSNHKIAPGLVTRRNAERKMFLQGGYIVTAMTAIMLCVCIIIAFILLCLA